MTMQNRVQDAHLLRNGEVVATGSASRVGATGWEGRVTVPGRFIYGGGDSFALRLPSGEEVVVDVDVSIQTARGRQTVSHIDFRPPSN